MRIFKISDEDRLVEYAEQDFKSENLEERLESWLENNPHCLSEDGNVLIIGRQVMTNLNSKLDLLAVDRKGDSVVIELKRDRTPRETIAQILEYASFVTSLSPEQLAEVFMQYSREETMSLADYHRRYFQLREDETADFNRNQKLLIVAQEITREIKQIATYLRKKGLDLRCLEFKCFVDENKAKLISTDFVVGKDIEAIAKVSSSSLPKINREEFMDSLDQNGKDLFDAILIFAEKNGLPIHWGTKGFSLNVDLGGNHVNILYCYPPHAVSKQTIYTVCAEIIRKVEDGESIADYYRDELKSIGGFERAGAELKFLVKRAVSREDRDRLLNIISEVVDRIEQHGPKEPSASL